ncbi:hypothetical protein [Rhodococcus sp. UFZ-B548]|uniref:hypothetical protein n=1 Tax=Rhodococcus sp. UFZ-B548 TaxID=2742212 RepID=UPI0015F59E42|nr:hypothetical protein [Rhodococcus sp. UFZ-B548]
MVKKSGWSSVDGDDLRQKGALAVGHSGTHGEMFVIKVAAKGLRRHPAGNKVDVAKAAAAKRALIWPYPTDFDAFLKSSAGPLHPHGPAKKRVKRKRPSGRDLMSSTKVYGPEDAAIYEFLLHEVAGDSHSWWAKAKGFSRLVKLIEDSSVLSRGILEVVVGGSSETSAARIYEERLRALKPIAEAVELESRELKAHVEQPDQRAPLSVELETATGPLDYVFPLSLEETLSSSEVGELLSPSGNPNRTLAQRRRQSNELLGVEISGYYRYPRFQIDALRRCIHPVVAYANSEMESSEDPWGTLDWWYTPDRILGGRPVDLVIAGELTEEAVDNTLAFGSRGMS